MKYSLKNKEFSRKKHSIFDNNQRRSRTKSTSQTPKKQVQNSSDNIQKQFAISIKPPSLNHSTIDKLNSLDSQANSIQNQRNEQDQSIMFQSFSKIEKTNNNNQSLRPEANTNYNILKPSQPIKLVKLSKASSELRGKNVSELSEPRSESFQVCEDDNYSRVNRFFAQSIMTKQSQSPMNKVVFEPVIRKSVSPEPKSLSPDQKMYQHFNKVTPINLKIQPESRVIYHHLPQSKHQAERKVNIVQIPRGVQKVESHRIVQPESNFSPSLLHQPFNELMLKNQHQANQIADMKQKLQEQNLQIQYLKNQKQILESNIELKFSPKKISYEPTHIIDHQTTPKTPEKYGIAQSHPAIMNQQLDRNKLIQLTQILKHNQAKIMFLQQKFQSFYSQIYEKFNHSLLKYQELLIKMFSQKYYNFTEELNAKLFLVDQKSTQVLALDHKIDVFTNTFRSIEESLRITKLKQQNIELSIENNYKKSDRFWNKNEGSRLLMMENQSDISSIRIFNDNQLQDKDREELKKLQTNLKQKASTSQWNENKHDDFIEFDSFLDEKYSHLVYNPKKQHKNSKSKEKKSNEKHRKSQHFRNKEKSPKKQFIVSQIYEETEKKTYNHKKSTSEEIEQFSPFQANEMFRNQHRNVSSANQNFLKYSAVTPSHDFTSSNAQRQSLKHKSERNQINLSLDDTSSKNYDFSQNSFEIEMDYKETPRKQLEKQISFTSQNMFKKNFNKTNSQNEDISDTLQGQQERLVKILKSKNYQLPVECWLDEMGCLRKKNQTYIFDDQGSVIMTTSAAFKKLKEKRFFI